MGSLRQVTSLLQESSVQVRKLEVYFLSIGLVMTFLLTLFFIYENIWVNAPHPLARIIKTGEQAGPGMKNHQNSYHFQMLAPINAAGSHDGLSVYLGSHLGEYQVWMDEKLLAKGETNLWHDEVWAEIPQHELDKSRALKFRLVIASLEQKRSVWRHLKPQIELGIYPNREKQQSLNWSSFFLQSRHYLLFTLYFLFGFIFFAIWRASLERWDYCFFSAFALLEGLIHLSFLAFANWQSVQFSLLAPVYFCELIFVLRVAFSFARVTDKWIAALYPTWFLGMISVLLLSSNEEMAQSLTNVFQNGFAPLVYGISCYVCWMQLWHVDRIGVRGIRRRKWRLFYVGALFFTICLCFIFENAWSESAKYFGSSTRALNLVLFFYIAQVFISDLKNRRSQNYWLEQTKSLEHPRAA